MRFQFENQERRDPDERADLGRRRRRISLRAGAHPSRIPIHTTRIPLSARFARVRVYLNHSTKNNREFLSSTTRGNPYFAFQGNVEANMLGMRDDGMWVRLSGETANDIPAPLRGAGVRLIKPVAYSNKHRSMLYSVETDSGEHWIVREDWFDDPPDQGSPGPLERM